MPESEVTGMSRSDFLKHPVRTSIYSAAYAGERGVPTRVEMEDLHPSVRSKVQDAIADVLEVRETGANYVAWRKADELAAEILEGAGEEARDAAYNAPPEEPAPTDPRELAARVPRGR